MIRYLGVVFLIVGAFLIGMSTFHPTGCGADCGQKLISMSAVDFYTTLGEIKDATILDIRTSQEYEQGHLPNAVNVDYYQTQAFSDYLDRLDRDKPYYIYCRTGNRSASALQLMQQKGFKQVTNLTGGIVAWETAELPIVR